MGGCGKPRNKKGNLNANRSDVKCWKCGYKGHIQVECRSKTKKKGWKGKKENHSKKGKDSSNIAAEGKEFAFMTTFVGAMLACNGSPLVRLEVDVYDSGTSSHMSPAQQRFISLMQIPPQQIKAADQTLFAATAVGELQVSISNEKGPQN